MKMPSFRVGVLVPFLFAVVFAKEPEKPGDDEIETVTSKHIVNLTEDKFDEFVKENEMVLVKFYAPWCYYCKKLAPAYSEVADQLAEKLSSVKLAKVDCTTETKLADKNEVKGYPTLKFFRKGAEEKYTGGRTAHEIMEWLEMMSGDAFHLIDAERYNEAKKTPEGVVFILTAPSEADAKNEHSIFTAAADLNRRKGKFFIHYHGDNNMKPEIKVYREEEDAVAVSDMTKDKLIDFIQEESFPLFGPINASNFLGYSERNQELVWYCGTKEDFNRDRAAVRDAAKDYRASYSFIWLDTAEFSGHATEALGVSTYPSMVYQSRAKGRYVLDNKESLSTATKIKQFFEDVAAGKVERSIKSEEVPKQNDDLVKVVVGKNFEEMIFREDKDVMLEVYAPWCKHCKELEPQYNALAESMKAVDHVVIAKMDGTANEASVDNFEWSGFPTLFYVKAGEKAPLKFNGVRTTEGMLEYIRANASKNIPEAVTATKPVDRNDEL